MSFSEVRCRGRARPWHKIPALLCWAPALAGAAALPAPARALDLPAAEALALDSPPALRALDAQAAAARLRASAARTLPDPELSLSVSNLPLSGSGRYRLDGDPMTMGSVGLMQVMPRAGKRRLEGQSRESEGQALEQAAAVRAAEIRRETALAWLALWEQERALALVAERLDEAERARAAAAIRHRAATTGQQPLRAAELEHALLLDRRDALAQAAAEARARLLRWTGTPFAALPAAAPELPPPPPLAELLAGLQAHPELQLAAAELAMRDAGLALAREARKPDWRVGLMYGWRPDLADMASVQVGVELPVRRGARQDRIVAAAAAERAAEAARHHDHVRMLRAQAEAAWHGATALEARLTQFAAAVLPAAEARTQAALADYRTARSELGEVVAARAAALDARLQHLALQAEALRRRVELRYFDSRSVPIAADPRLAPEVNP